MYDVTVEFPKFKVGVATGDGIVMQLKYLPRSAPSIAAKNPLAEKVAQQLEAYKRDPNSRFDLPIAIKGTELQKAVWQAICAIPRGKTRTYGDVARELGADARDIGECCGDNRLPLVIPCHRIVAADGLGGFAHATGGWLLDVKRWLLAHECGADEFRLQP